MKNFLSRVLRAVQFVSGLCCLALLLLAVLLLLVAPIPQMVFHYHWCRAHWWPAGMVVSFLTALGLGAWLWGLRVGKARLRRGGFLVLLGSLAGVAGRAYCTTAEWRIILGLFGACAFSLVLIYGMLIAVADNSIPVEGEGPGPS